MNNLEYEIKEFIVSCDVSKMTVKEIAERYYVSRAYVYRIINKMGYHSLQEVNEKKDQSYQLDEISGCSKIIMDYDVVDLDMIERLAEEAIKASNVYILGYYVSKMLAQYFTRQLVNLRINAIPILDVYQLKGYANIFCDSDLVICLSNTGTEPEINDSIASIQKHRYVITKYQSKLYNREKLSIGIKNNITEISNRFECENILEAMLVIQVCLFKIQSKQNKFF